VAALFKADDIQGIPLVDLVSRLGDEWPLLVEDFDGPALTCDDPDEVN
jgi:hypothetical protein